MIFKGIDLPPVNGENERKAAIFSSCFVLHHIGFRNGHAVECIQYHDVKASADIKACAVVTAIRHCLNFIVGEIMMVSISSSIISRSLRFIRSCIKTGRRNILRG